MNINDCIIQGITVQTSLTEPYIINIYGTADIEHVVPSFVHVNSVSYPMTHENVTFDYAKYKDADKRVFAGSFRWKIYYPIGSTVIINGRTATILSYTAPQRSRTGDNLYYLNSEVAFSDALPDKIVTNEAVEDKVIKDLNDILYANDNIKSLLPLYRHNIVELIGSDSADIVAGSTVAEYMDSYEKSTNTGYKSQMNYYMDADPFVWQNLKTAVKNYRKFYDFDETLTVDYYKNTRTLNSKSFVSWLYKVMDDARISGTETVNYNWLTIKGMFNFDDTIKYKFLTNRTLIIVVYTPAGYGKNLVLRLDPTTSIDNFNRLSVTFGVGTIAKNVAYETTVNVPFKTVTVCEEDSWGDLATLFMKLTHSDDVESAAEMLAYLNGAFDTYVTGGAEIPGYAGATFTRDPEGQSYTRLGVLTIGAETVDI